MVLEPAVNDEPRFFARLLSRLTLDLAIWEFLRLVITAKSIQAARAAPAKILGQRKTDGAAKNERRREKRVNEDGQRGLARLSA